MRLTVVGCAAAWGRGPDAASSCYLLEEAGTAVALDLGQGAYARLAVVRAPETLAAVFVSHAHPDHCIDLIPLRHYLRYEAEVPPGTVALHAPAGLLERFDSLVDEDGFLRDLPFTALAPGDLRVGSMRVTVARVTHAGDSFAFRVRANDASPGLVYSGDCGRPDEVAALVRPGDTLMCEASFGAGPVPVGVPHLDARGAAEAARAGGAARLVLTHVQAGVDPDTALRAARDVFAATLLARPGLTLEL